MDIFQRGWSIVFVQKSNFFLSVFFAQNYVRKDRFVNILDKKEWF